MSRERLLPVILGGLGMLVLSLVVAMASASIPGDEEPWLRLSVGDSSTLTAIWTWMIIVVTVVGIIVIAISSAGGQQRSRRRRRNLLAMLIGLAVLIAAIRVLFPVIGSVAGETVAPPDDPAPPSTVSTGGGSPIWWIALLVGAGAIAVLGSIGSNRRTASPRVGGSEFPTVAPAGAGPGRRRWEPGADPRSRVLAAYAAFEEGADEAGLPRLPSETARSHLGRVGRRLGLDPVDLGELSSDHARARFDAVEPEAVDAEAAEEASRRLLRGMR